MASDIAGNLQDSNFWVRYQAAQTLGAASVEAIEVHASTLASIVTQDESKLVRHEAAKALVAMGPACQKYSGQLARALKDPEQLVRRDAAKAFASMGAAAGTFASDLARRLQVQSEDGQPVENFWPVRWWSARALGSLQSKAVPHTETLAKASLDDVEPAVREASANALGLLGQDAVDQIRRLCMHLLPQEPKVPDEEQRRTRDALASALGTADTKIRKATVRGLDVLVRAAGDKVKASGSKGIGEQDLERKHEVSALEVALIDEEWLTRLNTIQKLQQLAA